MRSRVDENPSGSSLPGPGQPVYYLTDASQATFREIRRFTAPGYLAFCRLALAKLLRLPMRAPFGMAHESIRIVELGDVGERLKHDLDAALAQCHQQGFLLRFGVTVPVVGELDGGNLVHSNRERTVLAMAGLARAAARKAVVLALLSKLDDGRILSTTNARQRFDPPPGFEVDSRAGAPLSVLVPSHAARLKAIRRARVVVLDDVAQRQLVLDNSQRLFDYLRERGLFSPMTDAEVAEARAKTPPSL